MKKLLPLPLLLSVLVTNAQLLSWTPDFIKESSTPVVITMDANFGNKGLLNHVPTTDVYVHIGVITNKSTSTTDWKHSKFPWPGTSLAAQCTYLGNNKWSYTITGGLRAYFSVTDGTEIIQKIAILFRSGGNGDYVERNANGSDMYIPVYDDGVYARIDDPFHQPTYTPVLEPINKNVNDPLTITAKSSVAGSLKIFYNGNLLATSATASATTSTTITTDGDQIIIAEITSGLTVKRDTTSFVIPKVLVGSLPAGVKDGINYEPGDTSAILVLYAPSKKNVFVLGDFNDWVQSSRYQMYNTPDGIRYWIRLTHLTPGTEYAYQYFIDNTLKVADYNTEKVLDPYNDKYISTTTYPNLKAFPAKASGNVSILQTAKPKYTWQVNNFVRPDKRNLMIYELLIRDFVATQNWQTVKDTLSYLKRLGVNAIEVMPFNEFEGNISWGYNPSFYFAPDKAYGTETALKQFIDECHKQGIAVIMDVALNHSFGQSPMVQMYWDAAKNIPAANSPWFNQYAKHAYNVGYDINHESQATIDFVNSFINFWLTNYKLDGFRWDLSKGFTQKQTCDNTGNNCDVNGWSAYDQSRVDIWKRYYGFMQTASAGSYCILEHLAAND
ncbi:MAG TPA: alpha-amylase family glycosyl hydrolase, partial [Panacibacter sp.]|nr:alpha-amylase family glycosyl hydrolase [Panacibacter sp.]